MRKPLVVLLASAAIAFAACQGAATTAPSPSVAPSTAASPSAAIAPSPSPVDYDALLYASTYAPTPGRAGGSAVIGEWQAPDQLNPYVTNAFADLEVTAATMRALLNVSSDGHYVTDLAAAPITFRDSVKTDASGDGFTVHATLKPNLKWSDGQPLTMNDWKSTWQWVNDAAKADASQPEGARTGIITLGWEQIDKVDVAADGLSADFHFPKKFAGWLGTIGSNPPLPGHYIKTFALKDANKTYPISSATVKAPTSGPYTYLTVSPETIVLVRSDAWSTAGSHAPYLDKVTYRFYPDDKDGEIAAFKAGEIDLALDLQTADYDPVKTVDPSVGTAIIQPDWMYDHFDLNQAGGGVGKGHPALKDARVRTAIAMAIDKKASYQAVFPGFPSPEQDPCVNAASTNYWVLPDATCPTFDVAGANKILDDAGYTKGGDGIRTMPGDPTTRLELVHCTYRGDTGFHETSGQFLRRSLAAIGIQLDLNFVDAGKVLFANWPDVSADTKCNLSHGNYDTSEFLYMLTFDLFGDYYYTYASEQIPTDANKGVGYNYLRLNDPDMDAAINVLKDAIDAADQVQAAYKIQQVYTTTLAEIPLWWSAGVRGVSTRLQGVSPNPSTATDIWNIEDWWIKP